jgi:hypothetical protein
MPRMEVMAMPVNDVIRGAKRTASHLTNVLAILGEEGRPRFIVESTPNGVTDPIDWAIFQAHTSLGRYIFFAIITVICQ